MGSQPPRNLSNETELVSAIGLAPLVAHLNKIGIDSQPLFEHTNVALADVFAIKAKITRQQFTDFWNLAVEISGDPALAVHVGLSHGLSQMGPVGAVLQNAKDCHAALLLWNQYGRNVLLAPSFFLSVEGDAGILTLERVSSFSPERLRPLVEFVQFSLLNFSVQLCGDDITAEEGLIGMEFRHARPSGAVIDAYETATGPISYRFNASENRIIIRKEMLAMSVPKADPEALKRMQEQANHLMRLLATEQDIVVRVMAAIRRRLIGAAPSIHLISEDCDMSRATLQRRLRDQGSGFQKLLDMVRLEVAHEYLLGRQNQAGHSVLDDLSFLLGYSDTPAFCHAFKRWTGQTPNEYQLRGQT